MSSRSVTVVIPTCERPELLRRTAAGALAQRDVEVELVIVNDGRRPLDADMLELDGGRVRVLELSEHRGVGFARNAGIEIAEGRWIALLDDDDLWSAEKLARQLHACAAQTAGWAYAAGVYVDERLVPFEALPAPSTDGLIERLYRHQLIPGASSNLLVDAGLLREVGAFDERLHQLADWDLCLRLAERSPAARVQEVLLAYVQHAASMLLTSPAPIFREYDLFLAKHRAGARARGCSLDPESFTFWVANRLEKAGQRARAGRASLRGAVHYRQPSLLLNAARLALARDPHTSSEDASPQVPPWLGAYASAAPA
ncbi:MAG TPA: glycosyltransferase [Solirubrobacteraceae bacterium]|nr:glycosyltransferase [Solirubrobacteraceae bacterium]